MGQTTEKMDKVRDKNQNKDKNLNIDGNLNTDGNMNKAKGEASDKDCTMEEAFARLNDILGQLYAGGQSLEEAFHLYAEGMEMVRLCNEKIDRVEKQCLIIDENGESHEF